MISKPSVLSLAIVLITTLTFGQNHAKIYDFNGLDGRFPDGTPFLEGSYLYGMTFLGGTSGEGLIYRIKVDGTENITLSQLDNNTGRNPRGKFISDGTYFYGITEQGGTGGAGTIFKIKPDGSGFQKLWDFAGATGEDTWGSLVMDSNNKLYGMTNSGGNYGQGVIFRITTDGSQYDTLVNFNGANGGFTNGSLIIEGDYLFGMTQHGGPGDFGVVFKVKTDGTNYTKLLDFDGTNGKYPNGDLIFDGTYLYGMTNQGGANDFGVIFKIKPDGTSYSKLLDFAGLDGKYPMGTLYSDGTFLYGSTNQGGVNDLGALFRISKDGSNYLKMFDFGGVEGQWPAVSSLISDGTYLIGTAEQGGNNGFGVIYKHCIPPYFISVLDTIVCNGEDAIVEIDGHASTYTWSPNANVVSINGSTATINITEPTQFIITAHNSCSDSTITDTIFVDVKTCVNELIENANSSFIIHPNPTLGVFSIETNHEFSKIELYNLQGELITEEIISNSTYEFDISNLNKGLYIVKIINNQAYVVGVERLIKD